MFRVYACLVYRHDLTLVAAALAVLSLAVFTWSRLLRHAEGQAGRRRLLWVAGAGSALGCGAWAAHFISILALEVPFAIRFSVGVTALTLLIAPSLSSIGLWLGLRSGTGAGQLGGALVVAAAIAAMHYAGIIALRFPGTLLWDRGFIAASVMAECLLMGAAIPLTLRARARWHGPAGIGLMIVAVLALHFVGMAAASFQLGGGGTAATGKAISAHAIAWCVVAVTAVVLLLALVTLQVSRAAARRVATEQANMRSLADIAVEGLLVCDGEAIVAANSSFLCMTGYEEATLRGLDWSSLLLGGDAASDDLPEHDEPERLLIAASGARIPVEVVGKPILYAGRPHHVLAFRDLRERQKADETIRYLAHHDPLTGVMNRTAFAALLARQMRSAQPGQKPFAIFAIDLDRFKSVNDTLGHQGGDALLALAAARLQDSLRDTDCIARIGGDEFAVMTTPPLPAGDAMALANRIVEVLGESFTIEGAPAQIGASIGVALAPEDGTEAGVLLKHADLALYRAKALGRNQAVRYTAAMDVESESRRCLERDLRCALDQQQLTMRYQPLYCVHRQAVTGFEALLRWNHPERGMVSPADFIPLAEETGLIVPIGEFALNAALEEAARWSGDAYVAVNLSAVQFAHGALTDMVRAALARSGLPPWRLELEITESVLLQDSVETLRTLHGLRRLGVRFALDDFGTGYSSLHYLRSFPFDRIKIDKSFTQDMLGNKESAAIISAVVALSRALGIRTTAEGVETEEQLRRISAEGCDTIQGYLIGRPVPAEEARRLVGEGIGVAA